MARGVPERVFSFTLHIRNRKGRVSPWDGSLIEKQCNSLNMFSGAGPFRKPFSSREASSVQPVKTGTLLRKNIG